MKIALGLFIALFSFSTLADPQISNEIKNDIHSHECPIPSAEKLVCAVIMCDFGLVLGQWSSDCTQYKKSFAIYLATLGFWSKPPSCKGRDQNCNSTGKASKAAPPANICDDLTGAQKTACQKGQAVASSNCDDLSGTAQTKCLVDLAKNTDSCSELSGVAKDKCEGTYNPNNADLSPCENIPNEQAQLMCEQSILNNANSSSSSESSSASSEAP